MRILLLSHYYEPESGAPQQRWSALARRFVAAGHELAVLTPSPHYPTGALLPDGARYARGRVHLGSGGEVVHRVAFRPYSGQVGSRLADQLVAAADAAQLGSRRFRGRARPDVVVATVPSLPMLAAGVAVSRALGAPLVTELRDAWPDLIGAAHEWDAPAGSVPSRTRGRLRSGVQWAASEVITGLERRSALVVTTTTGLARTLQRRGMARTAVVRNAAHPVPELDRHTPREPDGTLNVLYAGTIGRAQGLATCVEAAALAASRGVPVRLRVVGAGAQASVVTRLAARLAAPVEVLGPVPRASMGAHYRWADSALVTLRPWPGLDLTVPSKLYELLALGIHVSAAVRGEAAEVLAAAAGGDVTPPGDHDALAGLWAALHADRSRLAVGASGAEWVAANADPDVLAEHYLAELAAVVA